MGDTCEKCGQLFCYCPDRHRKPDPRPAEPDLLDLDAMSERIKDVVVDRSSPEPREFWIIEIPSEGIGGSYVVDPKWHGDKESLINVIEKSAYDAVVRERDELRAEVDRLKPGEELLNQPIAQTTIEEMKRRLISWGYHVSDRDQFKEMAVERENESLKAEIGIWQAWVFDHIPEFVNFKVWNKIKAIRDERNGGTK
jgi:hypothetical protein